jgi:hypothetical protein
VQPVDHFCLSYVPELLPFISISHKKLSETPFAPSQHKSAANIRICTAIRLLLNPDIPDEQQFVVLNTHLDHQSDLARRFGASLMLHRARHEAAKFGPVLVFGDFDKHAVSSSLMECVALVRCSPPTGSDSGAYAIMTRQRAPAATFVQTGTTIKCQCGNAPRARPELDMLNEESVSECSVAYKVRLVSSRRAGHVLTRPRGRVHAARPQSQPSDAHPGFLKRGRRAASHVHPCAHAQAVQARPHPSPPMTSLCRPRAGADVYLPAFDLPTHRAEDYAPLDAHQVAPCAGGGRRVPASYDALI